MGVRSVTPLDVLRGTILTLDWTVVWLLGLQLGLFLLVLIAAIVALRERPPPASSALLWRRYAEMVPPITIIAPAFNEALTIVESVEALLALEYPDFEVIVVNDGSRDNTLELLVARFELKPTRRLCQSVAQHAPMRGFYASPRVPRLLVVDKEPGGSKADATNAGINASRTPLICITDADTLIEPDALLRGAWLFVDDPMTVAVGGTIRIANGSKVDRGRVIETRLSRNFLALVQTLEYERSFMLARTGLSRLGALMIVSGAFGLFRRDAVMEVGGYSPGSLGEDLDLVVKLHRHFRGDRRPYSIKFLAEPIVWTQAPESLGDLGRQRARWERGSLETLWKFRGMVGNPYFGAVGLIGFGQLLLVDAISPIVVVASYFLVPLAWAGGLLAREHYFAFLTAVMSFGILMSALSLVLGQILLGRINRARDLAVLGLVAVVENFGYRQLCNVWRLWGWYLYLRKRQGWGPMQRKAFSKS
jgi:cellulose synthase/poly-beta-1,6-N-acetylglucosamine synthase-like glycosyltransferase